MALGVLAAPMSMSVMHENMHEGAQQDQQIWQVRNRQGDVSRMLLPKEITCYGKENGKGDPCLKIQAFHHVYLSLKQSSVSAWPSVRGGVDVRTA